MLQACWKLSISFLPPGLRVGHRCGPASESRGVLKRPTLKYRLRKGWRGYKDSRRIERMKREERSTQRRSRRLERSGHDDRAAGERVNPKSEFGAASG